MTPRFWKLSHGSEFFTYGQFLQHMEERLVYVHKDTHAKGGATTSQGDAFSEAKVGDYFYLTHGNQGIYVLGQFTGPANVFSAKGEGWLDRPYRHIKSSVSKSVYAGQQKWWTPDNNSTFMQVPPNELALFEQLILWPYFEIALATYKVKA